MPKENLKAKKVLLEVEGSGVINAEEEMGKQLFKVDPFDLIRDWRVQLDLDVGFRLWRTRRLPP